MSDRYPMKLKPHVVETVWGGNRLAKEYGIDPQGRANCAEAWLLSTRADASSIIMNSKFAGMSLGKLYAGHRHLFGRKCIGREDFPMLIKFIDALDDLSVQVHPRDSDMAVLQPGESGKAECWYILDARPGAKLYLGFNKVITKSQFAEAIGNNTLMDFVQAFDVKKGDFFYIPAGTLHAIGKGVLLAEVQQNSDTTYRIYDYNRLQNGKPRALHLGQAMDVTDLAPYEVQQQISKTLVSNEYFTVKESSGRFGFSSAANADSFISLVFIEADKASCKLSCETCNEILTVEKGDSIFIPAGLGEFKIEGMCKALVTQL